MSAKIFLATIGQGLARASRCSLVEWSVEFLIPKYDVRCLAADPFNSHVVYSGTQGNGVLRSNDGGKTWYAAGLTGQIVKALAGRRGKAGTIYARTKPALLFVSRDCRANWTELASFRRIPSRWFWFSQAEKPFTAYVQAIALSPTDGNSIVVGIEAGAVVRSLDGGQTWSGHLRGALRDYHSLTFHATSGDWVYEGGVGAPVQAPLSAAMEEKHGRCLERDSTGTTAGQWLPILHVQKSGMFLLLQVP